MTTLMWEAVATDVDAVVAWALSFHAEGMTAKEVYVSADDRVVMISHWSGEPPETLTPPAGSLVRDGHAWRFTLVR
ncbi:MAG TPA: hypothetical protein VNQ77_14520 [Frankiaceae bacterium]|nr:hypothetical protein [Frankiaceae bacterium]